MIRRDRKKQVIIGDVNILTVYFSAVVQVGDVYADCWPFSYGEAYGGYRGAPSFATEDVPPPQDTRLHFANQLDEDVRNSDIIGDNIEVFRPNIRGEAAR
jgi:hypothetical protein